MVILMVPDSVKKVPRPTNTVVVDTGSKGARRYAVRCRSGYSLTVNNNPGPRNGKTIGYIVSGRFIEKNTFVDSVSSYQHEFLQYGAATTIYVHCADIYDDLLKLFNVEDANRLMTVASLRVTNPGIACNRYQSKASISFISEYYPCIGLSSSSISTFIDNLGKQTSVLKSFYSLRFEHVTESQNVIIDGVLKQDTGDDVFSMPSAKTHLKGHDEISIIYSYRTDMAEALCAKAYLGNMLDAKAFHDFIADNNINRGILICDKGFPLSNIEDLLEANPDLHYISPIRRNSTLISQHRMLESDQVATLDDGNVVMYKKVKLDDGRCLYCVRDIGRSNFEKKGILDRALAKDCKIDGESFVNKLASQGTITFVSDLDLDPLAILNHYNNRWQLEVVFDHFKNTLDLDITRVQSKTSVIGNEFINFLATLITCKLVAAFKKVDEKYGKEPWSLKTRLEDLRDIDRRVDAPRRGAVDDGYWNLPARNRSMALLVQLGIVDDPHNTLSLSGPKLPKIYNVKSSDTQRANSKYEVSKSFVGPLLSNKRPGRPKGLKSIEKAKFDAAFIGPMPPKRGPGRPKGSKNKSTLLKEAMNAQSNSIEAAEKRGRGRPRGSRNKSNLAFENSFVGPMPDLSRLPKKKAGRPKGSTNRVSKEFKMNFIGPMPVLSRLPKKRPGRPKGAKNRKTFMLS